MARSNPIRSSAIFAAGIVFVLLAFATPKADAATESNRTAIVMVGNICRTPRSGNGSCSSSAGVAVFLKSGDNRIIARTTTTSNGSVFLNASTSLSPRELTFIFDGNVMLLTADVKVTMSTLVLDPPEFLQ